MESLAGFFFASESDDWADAKALRISKTGKRICLAFGGCIRSVEFGIKVAKKKPGKSLVFYKRSATTYSSAWFSSTICASGLNDSVRKGKR